MKRLQRWWLTGIGFLLPSFILLGYAGVLEIVTGLFQNYVDMFPTNRVGIFFATVLYAFLPIAVTLIALAVILTAVLRRLKVDNPTASAWNTIVLTTGLEQVVGMLSSSTLWFEVVASVLGVPLGLVVISQSQKMTGRKRLWFVVGCTAAALALSYIARLLPIHDHGV